MNDPKKTWTVKDCVRLAKLFVGLSLLGLPLCLWEPRIGVAVAVSMLAPAVMHLCRAMERMNDTGK